MNCSAERHRSVEYEKTEPHDCDLACIGNTARRQLRIPDARDLFDDRWWIKNRMCKQNEQNDVDHYGIVIERRLRAHGEHDSDKRSDTEKKPRCISGCGAAAE